MRNEFNKTRGRDARPEHPGSILKHMYLEPLGLTITDAAKALCMTRKSLSEFVNGKWRLSPELAIKLSKSFSTTPELWLNMQSSYDLWKYREFNVSKVKVLYRPDDDSGENEYAHNMDKAPDAHSRSTY